MIVLSEPRRRPHQLPQCLQPISWWTAASTKFATPDPKLSDARPRHSSWQLSRPSPVQGSALKMTNVHEHAPSGNRPWKDGSRSSLSPEVDLLNRRFVLSLNWYDKCPVSKTVPQRYFYGSDCSQFADLYRPLTRRQPGVVVLLHGGWWGPHFGLDHLETEAVDLCQRGWVVWNIEYRRLDLGGGYPTTLNDVAAAIDYLATLSEVDTDCVVAVGHSAGGHLATWAAGRRTLASSAPGADPAVDVAGVISLAGVVDLGTAARQLCGDGAVVQLMGGGPNDQPQWYKIADPLAQVPIPSIVRCVHARNDDRVPFELSVNYVTTARAAGQDVELLEVDGDHFSVANASSKSWPTVVAAIEELMRSK